MRVSSPISFSLGINILALLGLSIAYGKPVTNTGAIEGDVSYFPGGHHTETSLSGIGELKLATIANRPERGVLPFSAAGLPQTKTEPDEPSNPFDLLSVEDMPPELQDFILSELAKEDAAGYLLVSDFDAKEIVNITEHVIGFDESEANLIFEIADMPEVILKNYDYLGYTHPNYSIKPAVARMKNGTLRRVFRKRTTGNLLIVEQSVQQDGNGSRLIKEAVNTTVSGFPARFGIKKSDSNKQYASLNWNTHNQSFILYQINDIDNARTELGSIAEAFETKSQ